VGIRDALVLDWKLMLDPVTHVRRCYTLEKQKVNAANKNLSFSRKIFCLRDELAIVVVQVGDARESSLLSVLADPEGINIPYVVSHCCTGEPESRTHNMETVL
jgi:hypothetical protein